LLANDGNGDGDGLKGVRGAGRASFPCAKGLTAIDFTPFLTHL